MQVISEERRLHQTVFNLALEAFLNNISTIKCLVLIIMSKTKLKNLLEPSKACSKKSPVL